MEMTEIRMVIGLGMGSSPLTSTPWSEQNRRALTSKKPQEHYKHIHLQKPKTHVQVLSLGIPLSDLASHPVTDLAIGGADKVDPHLNLVKGQGRPLLREKIVEGGCKKFFMTIGELYWQ